MIVQWVLVVMVTAQMGAPITAFDNELECTAAMQAWEVVPPARVDCVLVTLQKPRPVRRRSKQ
jgi:hypothetical protein